MNTQNLEVVNKIRLALINNGNVDCFKSTVIKMAENLPELKGMIESTQTMMISSLHDEIEKTLKGKDYADSSLHDQVRATAYIEIEKNGGLGQWNPPKPMLIPAELSPLAKDGFVFAKSEIKGRFSIHHPDKWIDGVADYIDQENVGNLLKGSGYLVVWTNLKKTTVYVNDKDGNQIDRVIKLPSIAEIYKAR